MKIRDVIEGNETYWTKKWAWRNMNTRDTKLDSLRQDSLIQRIILAEESKPEARFATPDEHKASRPKL
jgi:sarcosine oxidase/L-pipecolate oxidase